MNPKVCKYTRWKKKQLQSIEWMILFIVEFFGKYFKYKQNYQLNT